MEDNSSSNSIYTHHVTENVPAKTEECLVIFPKWYSPILKPSGQSVFNTASPKREAPAVLK